MKFLDLFSDDSELYASARPRYPEALFAFIAALTEETQFTWDCGTGTGQAAVGLAGHFAQVNATDPSAQQIANAASHDRVTYSVQPAETTAFPNSWFDAVCVAQALHWFNLPVFFQEVQRVLKPGGVFAAWGYAWFHVSPDFAAVFNQTILEEIATDWAPQNKLLWDGYREVAMPFDEIPAPHFQICAQWTFYQLMAYVHTWSSVRRCKARTGDDFFNSAAAALLKVWGNPDLAREVTMPIHLRAGRIMIK